METIFASIISAAITLIVCIINNNSQNAKTRALMEYRLEELTKKVEKHNNLVERTYKLEEISALQEEKIKVANNRIKNLELKK